MSDPLDAILQLSASGLLVALVGVPILLLHLATRDRGGRLLPAPGEWRVAENGFAVFFAFLLYYYLQPVAMVVVLQSGFLGRLYGPDFLPGPQVAELTPEHRAAMTIAGQWAALFAFPFLVPGILAILRGGSTRGALPLSARGLPRNLLLGYLGWWALTPACFGVFLLANLVFIQWLGQPADQHPATLFAPLAGTREWLLFGAQVLLIAPTLEELLFRGGLLPWLNQRPVPGRRRQEVLIPHARRGEVVLAIALIIGVAWQWTPLQKAVQDRDVPTLLQRLTPVLFILSLVVALYALPRWRWLGRRVGLRTPRQGKAVVASAAFFAAVHSSWPTPVPLFVLGLGLATLTLRARTVVPAVALHSLFNAVSVVYLVRGGTL